MARPLARAGADRVALYDAVLARNPAIERKGATMPYTSVNGKPVYREIGRGVLAACHRPASSGGGPPSFTPITLRQSTQGSASGSEFLSRRGQRTARTKAAKYKRAARP